MKKALASIAVITALCSALAAQSGNWQYCEIVGTAKFMSRKLTIELDYGQAVSFWNGDKRVVDPATGKPKSFNSMVDAMNFLGEVGWEFVQAYTVSEGNQNVYHWLLKIPTERNASGEAIPVTKGAKKE